MSKTHFLFSLQFLWLMTAPSSWAAEVNLEGQCLEKLRWYGDYLVEFSSRLGIAYRKNQNQKVFLLVEPSNPSGSCGVKAGHTIVATLVLKKEVPGTWYAVNFDCSNQKEVNTGDAVVGLFERNGSGPALEAWKIDTKGKRFVKVNNMVCKSFS